MEFNGGGTVVDDDDVDGGGLKFPLSVSTKRNSEQPVFSLIMTHGRTNV